VHLYHEFEGRSSRLDSPQAAILSAKLRNLDSWTEHRIGIANHYLDRLQGISELILPVRKNWARATNRPTKFRMKGARHCEPAPFVDCRA
jgi:dTDP-4-amino-4,6-dideoxygalactose transaminase